MPRNPEPQVRDTSACVLPFEVLGEVGFDAAEHLLAEDVAGTGLDVVGEPIFGAPGPIGPADDLHARLYLLHRAAAVRLAGRADRRRLRAADRRSRHRARGDSAGRARSHSGQRTGRAELLLRPILVW